MAYAWLFGPFVPLLWVVLIHSRKRWPHVGAWQRWVHIITFDGDWMRRNDAIRKGAV